MKNIKNRGSDIKIPGLNREPVDGMRGSVITNYDVFIQQSGLATAVLDIDLRFVKCNDQFLDLAGSSEDKIINSCWFDLISYDYPYTPLENSDIYRNMGLIPSGKFWCSISTKSEKNSFSDCLL